MPDFTFTENNNGIFPVVTVSWEQGLYGDPLTDNAWREDFYRYHDVFHFGLHALQGYSAVVSHFMGDATEGRVRKLEECLAVMAFTEAGKKDFFQQKNPSLWLYRFWCEETKDTGLAPPNRKQWAQNLKDIYAVWKELAEHRGGIVVANKERRVLQYRVG